NFLTGYRLAELLAAPRLAASGRRPVSTAVVAAAIRRVLATDPGPLFASVAAHPATEEALVGAHRELADLDADALDRLAQHLRRRRRSARGGARHRRRDARGRAARTDGGRDRQQRAVRAAAARPPRAGRHRAQRRFGADARRLRARARPPAPAGATRSRIPS